LPPLRRPPEDHCCDLRVLSDYQDSILWSVNGASLHHSSRSPRLAHPRTAPSTRAVFRSVRDRLISHRPPIQSGSVPEPSVAFRHDRLDTPYFIKMFRSLRPLSTK
jgi:hypothetical protein